MIRAYQNSDVEDVIRVCYSSTILAHDFIPESFWEDEKETVRNKYMPMAETYVYEIDEEIRGFISLLQGNEIGALFVVPKHQGCGIGKALIDYVFNIHNSYILHVFEQNHKGRGFYKKMGFKEISRGIEPSSKCPDLVLKKTVS